MLALVERGVVSAEVLAREGGIPVAFLEKILLDLRRAGLVGAIRGTRGGYYLTLPPQSISVGQVLGALGEKWQLRGQGSFMELVEGRIAKVVQGYLEGLTLADLYFDWQSWKAQQQGDGGFTI